MSAPIKLPSAAPGRARSALSTFRAALYSSHYLHSLPHDALPKKFFFAKYIEENLRILREMSIFASNFFHVFFTAHTMKYISGNPFFDPKMPIAMWRKNLPHWEQEGKIQYLTFRLADSLPRQVVDRYRWEKENFLRLHPRPWDEVTRCQYSELVSNPIEGFLDAGYGACVLKEPMVRQFLIDSINYYDGERFLVLAYVIMPNHVHMLCVAIDGYGIDETISSMMRFSATGINRHLGRKGKLWQSEPFDSLVRNPLHYNHCLEYIRHNPDHLPPGWYAFGGMEFR